MEFRWSGSVMLPTAIVGDADLVADAIGERRLEHAAIDRLRLDRSLPGRDVDQIGARLLERARDLHRIIGR